MGEVEKFPTCRVESIDLVEDDHDLNFAIRPCRNGDGWVVIAKRGDIITKLDTVMIEPGPIWFAFGDTPKQALDNLYREGFG